MKTRKIVGVENPTIEIKHKCALCPYSTNTLSPYKQHLKAHSNEKPFKCPESECPYRAKQKQHVKQHVINVHLLNWPSGSDSDSKSKSKFSRLFPCPESGCNYATKDKSNLRAHSIVHSDKKSFFCSQANCNFSTKYKNSLTSHTQTHTGEKPFVCQFESCSYAAATSSQLMVHTRTHTKERPFKCPEPNCEYSATQRHHLQQHQLTHGSKEGDECPSFSCPLCEYKGNSKKRLTAHIKRHTLEKLFKCDEPNCNFEAKTKREIRLHKIVHSDERPFACSFESCEFRGKYKSNLSKHLKTHKEEKPFACSFTSCGFRSKYAKGLSDHFRTHYAERRYKCELCPYRGKTWQAVRSHLTCVHPHPHSKLFKCSEFQCGFTAKTSSNLRKHEMLIHEPDKLFKCPLCSFETKTHESLLGHVRTHTKEEPFICKEKSNGCEYRAKTSSVLRQHEKRSHPQILS